MRALFLLFCFGFAAYCDAGVFDGVVVSVPSREGVSERVLIVHPPATPLGSAVLMMGGDGVLDFDDHGVLTAGQGNFLVRRRDDFAQAGYLVVLPAAPSDRRSLFNFRNTADHASDLGSIIQSLHHDVPGPVWIIGTSRGTISAVNAAIRLPFASERAPDGVVLTSSMTTGPDRLSSMALERVQQPVLLVHHHDDGCRMCPYRSVSAIVDGLSQAHVKVLITVEGGDDQGDPCQPWAHHGYAGIEAEVTGKIITWINAHPPVSTYTGSGRSSLTASQPLATR